MTRPLVLVTGVTGYLAGNCATDLLEHGYDVRGTVRDPANAAVGHLRAAAERAGARLELVRASLLDDTGWDAALDGVALVEHVASPAPKYRPRTRKRSSAPRSTAPCACCEPRAERG